jgi:DNA-binding transcriptional LysR family regulator
MDMARQFQSVLTVIEKGSVGKAAEALNVSQPALTKSIRRLEDRLGVPLFYREGRGMRPTIYAEVLRAHAQGITVGIKQALEEVAALRAGSEGTVRLAAGPLVSTEIVAKAALRLMRHRPKLRVQIHTAVGDHRADLLAGKYDFILGLLPAGDPPSTLSHELIFEDRIALIARCGHPLLGRKRHSAQTLVKATWVMPFSGHYHRRRLENVFEEAHLPPPEPTIECSSTDFIKRIVASTDHVGVLAGMGLGDEDAASLSEIPLTSRFMRRPVGIIWRKHHVLSTPSLLLIDEIRRVCSDMTSSAREEAPITGRLKHPSRAQQPSRARQEKRATRL